MSAPRAKIGLIKPSPGNLPFWQALAPAGVEIVAVYLGYTRGDRENFAQGFARAERLAAELKEAGCDLIAMCGTPPALLAGLDFERQWGKTMSERLGRPVTTPMEGHALALNALGARKVAVATYYGDELNQAIVHYLARFGLEAALMGGFSLTGESEALFTTPMGAQWDISAEQVYDYCQQGLARVGSPVDAIYINGGGWKNAGPVLDRLERDFDVKVVWGPVAEMWHVYRTLGIRHTAAGAGSLLRGGVA